MEIIEISGANRLDTWTKERCAARGIVVRDGKILLSFLSKSDMYMLPGGGVERGETWEECCEREVREETGYMVRTRTCPAEITEYYGEYKFITRYYMCDICGQTDAQHTQYEREHGLTAEWMPTEECLNLFKKNNNFAEEKRGLYAREYAALQAAMRSGGTL